MIGQDGQRRISKSGVLVVGLGALGSLISTLLARAGVGFLRIVDVDSPETHNLQRQILYDEADVASGLSKAQSAERKLRGANSEAQIEAVTARVGPQNISQLAQGVDLIIDALDNIATRYYVNDTAVARGVPYIFGGAVAASGNVMVIIPGKTPCLRCVWPDSEGIRQHDTAAQVGVLSSAATAVASIEVTEALKILSGHSDAALKGLLLMDFWQNIFRIASVEPNPDCSCRGSFLPRSGSEGRS